MQPSLLRWNTRNFNRRSQKHCTDIRNKATSNALSEPVSTHHAINWEDTSVIAEKRLTVSATSFGISDYPEECASAKQQQQQQSPSSICSLPKTSDTTTLYVTNIVIFTLIVNKTFVWVPKRLFCKYAFTLLGAMHFFIHDAVPMQQRFVVQTVMFTLHVAHGYKFSKLRN